MELNWEFIPIISHDSIPKWLLVFCAWVHARVHVFMCVCVDSWFIYDVTELCVCEQPSRGPWSSPSEGEQDQSAGVRQTTVRQRTAEGHL